MKFLVVFAILCLLQAIAGQEIKEVHKLDHQNQEHIGIQNDEHAVHNQIPQNQDAGEQQPTQVNNEIPPQVQQVVTQVSQHIPIVVGQHVAKLKRMQRSLKNQSNWQRMQLNAGERAHKCNFICNQVDVTVCGYNGRCYREFESQCELSAYNCLNTQKIFHVVEEFNCQEISLPKCYPGDM